MANLAALLKQPIEQQVKKISVSLNFEFVSTVEKFFFWLSKRTKNTVFCLNTKQS